MNGTRKKKKYQHVRTQNVEVLIGILKKRIKMNNFQRIQKQNKEEKIKNLALMIYKATMYLLAGSAIMLVIWLAAWGGCLFEKVCREENFTTEERVIHMHQEADGNYYGEF